MIIAILVFVPASAQVSVATGLTITPSTFTVTPTTLPAGDVIAIVGSYFSPNVLVSITLGSTNGPHHPTTLGSVTSNSTGGFSISLATPASDKPGEYTLRAHDSTGKQHASNIFLTTTIAPIIASIKQKTPYQQKSPNPLTINGSGFLYNAAVKISLNGTPLGSIISNSTGGFSGSVSYTGLLLRGTYSITASDGVNSAQKNLAIGRYISASSYSVISGQKITIIGSGQQYSVLITLMWITPAGQKPVYVQESADMFNTSIIAPTVTSTGPHKLEALIGTVSENNITITIAP